MSYTPPVGTANLPIGGVLGYTEPVGVANLEIGHLDTTDRVAVLTGATTAPSGLISVRRSVLGAISGTTAAPTGRMAGAYDPNLLSEVCQVFRQDWQDGQNTQSAAQSSFQSANPVHISGHDYWQDSGLGIGGLIDRWIGAELALRAASDGWQEALLQDASLESRWSQSQRLEADAASFWQEGAFTGSSFTSLFKTISDRLEPSIIPSWQDGATSGRSISTGMRDGLLCLGVTVEVWQETGFVWNANNLPKDRPPDPPPVPHSANLRIWCSRVGTNLPIGRTQCILIAEREIPVRKTYMTINNASLVRWPDLTPLPVVEMSVETDFDSWCWGLTATLVGSDAWTLVQPNPLACEVQATINGQVWRFLLDVPANNRSFNYNRITLRGRSRSAWLHDPYTPVQNFSQINAHEMIQLAEAALYNTGWTIDWKLDNWVVPAGYYTSWNTPIGELIKLATATDDGLYTDPYLQVITAQKRWPIASWLVDGETIDLLIPDAAVINLTQSPLYSQPYNGVYVSGTSYGALALVKISGTDGALQPAEPLVNALLCDEDGVAARARGLNLLSNSGAGWTMDADVLFAPEIGLIKPGMIVSIAGLKGISRSCRIQCSWSDSGLTVKQTVALERREVEQS